MAGGPVVVCMGETAAVEAGDALLAMEEAPPPLPRAPHPTAHAVAHTHRRGEQGEHAAPRLDHQPAPGRHRASAPGGRQYTWGYRAARPG
jgi:hypothetical protein